MHHIYIVRHGQSQDNAHKTVSGQRDIPLSLLGKEQARLAGQQAARLRPDLIVSSPLKRARQTAEIIAQTIGYPTEHIHIIPALKERFQGDLQGTIYGSNLSQNGDFPNTENTPGVEPLDLLHQRVHHALRDLIKDPHKTILVVCHQNICRMMRTIVADRPVSRFFETERLENGQIYKLL